MYKARLQQQLKQQILPQNDTGCWVWQGQLSNSGHGRIKIQIDGSVKMVSAEDASFIAFIGDIPERHLVLQNCNNRLCINPEHLYLKQY